ncbi:MAG: hypothetical protein FD146_994 [Anaerolineaceae bacterium]|nr:MAG: hypothetical protein FD146_994 [Anaerolineaceae bacterium]
MIDGSGFLGFQLLSIFVSILALVFPAAIIVLLVMIYRKTRSIEKLLKKE